MIIMLENLLRIPDTFDPDDRRRRQILNILLIVFTALALLSIIVALFIIHNRVDPGGGDSELVLIPGIFLIVISSALLVTNRSASVPGWLNGVVFLILLMVTLLQSDTPQQLYNGRSLILWVIPIMVGALILHPGSVFAIAAVISGLIWFFLHTPTGTANFYSM